MEPAPYQENRDDNLLCQEFMIKRPLRLETARVECPQFPPSDSYRDQNNSIYNGDMILEQWAGREATTQ